MTTFVLIHGAYQGGWVWQRVTARLVAAGHTVFAPSLDGCAERRHAVRPGINTETHGGEIAELLFFEDLRDVVLVGTSSGGMVLCAAAERARDRIARLVFADAFEDLASRERMLDTVVRSAFQNSGQICLCGSRILVERSVYEVFRNEFVAQGADPGDVDLDDFAGLDVG